MARSLHNTPHDRLPEGIRKRIARLGRMAVYHDGDLIHERGDEAFQLSLIMKGAVRLSNVGLSGKRITSATLKRGEVYGVFQLFTGEPRTHDAHAVGETSVVVLGDAVCRTALDTESEFRDFLIGFHAHRLARAMELLEDERRLTLPARLAKRLLVRCRREDVEDHVTQAELAQELGVSRYAVGLALARLGDLGLIETGYQRVAIPRRDRLIAWVSRNGDLARVRRAGGGRTGSPETGS